MKVTRTVWSRGKVRDNIKDLPIAIILPPEKRDMKISTLQAENQAADLTGH
jgi:hypothetical protein